MFGADARKGQVRQISSLKRITRDVWSQCGEICRANGLYTLYNNGIFTTVADSNTGGQCRYSEGCCGDGGCDSRTAASCVQPSSICSRSTL